MREIHISSVGDQPWDFFGRNEAKAEAPVLWPPHVKSWLIGKDSDAERDWGQEEKEMTEDEMAGWHHGLNGLESEWTPGDGDGQGGLVCCDSWGRKESDTTERLNWTEEKKRYYWVLRILQQSSRLERQVWLREMGSFKFFQIHTYYTHNQACRPMLTMFPLHLHPSHLRAKHKAKGDSAGCFHPRKTKTNQINSLNICVFNSFCDFTVGNGFCTYHIHIHTHRGSLVCMHTRTTVHFIK